VTSREDHDIKTAKLDQLNPYFKPFLQKNQKAILYFVVPPYISSTFKKQKYVYPTTNGTTPEGAKTPSPCTTQIIESTSAPEIVETTSAAAIVESRARGGPPDWVEQWVMYLDVNTLTAALQSSGSEMKNKRARLLEN
jgi:hypothetical protein